MVPPPSRTLAPSHPKRWQLDLCVLPSCGMNFFNALSTNLDDHTPQTLLETMNLTLRAPGEILDEFPQAN